MQETRERIKLRFWEALGPQLLRTAAACDQWFDQVLGYLRTINGQIDAETAPIEIVDLLAWQRDVDRITDEPEELYRKRVKYALANAKDAGCKRGFAAIWERLGLGKCEQTERFDLENWDVIRLEIDEWVFGRYVGLFEELIKKYGRTCRRYEFSSIVKNPMEMRAAGFYCDVQHCLAKAANGE